MGPLQKLKEEIIMANVDNEKVSVTGLDTAENRRDAEYDLVKGLLEASEYKTAEDSITEIEIKRAGKFLFSFHIHPISEADLRFARKKATIYMPNPNNKKLPPIEKDSDPVKFKSWVIYLATTEEDQQKVWGNPAIMQKFALAQPAESVDILLNAGEKTRVFDEIGKISGMDDESEEIDLETFQS